MNGIQRNYFEKSILDFGICSNKTCHFNLSAFLTEETTRCPLCDEPAELPSSLMPTINNKSTNVFERFFPEEVASLYKDQLSTGENIGNTPLSLNQSISNWVGIGNLFLKEEQQNPSGSFKDRGSWMASALISAKLKKGDKDCSNFILGTVSTGNMAISTAFLINQINTIQKNKNLRSFIVVSSNTKQKKIDAMQKAAGKTGTTIFVIEGEYAKFHQEVYNITNNLRNNGVSIFAQLTDDVFRISGYATLFTEIIEQTKNHLPDYIVLPIGSGALFRSAVWTLESLFIKGIIKKIPRIILVQEKGGDPIINALENNLSKIKIIPVKKNVVADAIAVSNSRSGNPVLNILREKYHIGVSVNSKEILEAQNVLNENGFFVEEASCASLAAVKKLTFNGTIFPKSNVICVLTGAEIKKRNLPKVSPNTKLIYCKLEDLREKVMNEYSKEKERLEKTTNGYFY